MLSTSIGAVTLEMDNKLTSLLKEVDKAGVDVSNPKELLRAAKELASESIKLGKQGKTKAAAAVATKAKGLQAIGKKIEKVPVALLRDMTGPEVMKLTVDPVPASATALKDATEILLPNQPATSQTVPAGVSAISPAIIADLVKPSTTTTMTAAVMPTTSLTALLPTRPTAPSTVKLDAGSEQQVQLPTTSPDPAASGNVTPSANVDQGLSTLAKAGLAAAAVGGIWLLMRRRK